MLGLVMDQIEQLTGARPNFTNLNDAAARLREVLAEGERQVLLVLDDVWNEEHVKPFLQGCPTCAHLITTRLQDVAVRIKAQIVDVNEMAEGHDYYALSGLNVSPDNRIAAFGVDTLSRRQYDLRFKDLETGKLYPEEIKNTMGSSAWANDNRTVFYASKNPVTLRNDKIYRHVLGTDPVRIAEELSRVGAD